ncbi:MAG: phospho-N-acetylmuramoyl-pentapeptide-transferase [Eubacteriales bacterium]
MKAEMFVFYCVCALLVFLLTALGSRWIIPKLKSLKMGQKILDIGPRWHKGKEGTPTMGGLTFIASTILVLIVALLVTYFALPDLTVHYGKLILCLSFALVNGAIGFVDDLTKFTKKQNKGLSPAQKYLLQLIAAGLFLFAMKQMGYISTTLYIPYLKLEWEMGFFYYIFALILITGIVNSVNLTDGIDGLASTVTFVVAAFFSVAAFTLGELSEVIAAALLVGATLGFLVYNAHPAKIFMGDTGSLYLGGYVVALAFMIDNPLILLPVGIVYICESLSDILQVGYYKISHGKRIFKMAPIHHHFEKCGWSENKIVLVFSLVTLIFCILAYFGIR